MGRIIQLIKAFYFFAQETLSLEVNCLTIFSTIEFRSYTEILDAISSNVITIVLQPHHYFIVSEALWKCVFSLVHPVIIITAYHQARSVS
jgi:hypothetical protein